MMNTRQAYCLCGAVRFAARLKDGAMQACHCAQCQRWTGGGPLWTVRVEDDLQVSGEENIRTYHASAHGERAYCGSCGTNLYWKIQGRRIAFLPVGLFDDQTGLEVREEIFADRRPGWMPVWPDAVQHNEAEMQAQLTAFLEGEAR
jgi:hypothetical protein